MSYLCEISCSLKTTVVFKSPVAKTVLAANVSQTCVFIISERWWWYQWSLLRKHGVSSSQHSDTVDVDVEKRRVEKWSRNQIQNSDYIWWKKLILDSKIYNFHLLICLEVSCFIIKILNLLYHAFMFSLLILLSSIYPLSQWHSLLVTVVSLDVTYNQNVLM